MTGPAGGEWIRVSTSAETMRYRCHACGSMFASGFAYTVGITRHVEVCDGCATRLTEEES